MPNSNAGVSFEKASRVHLEVSPEAEWDLIEAMDWYAERDPELSDRLELSYRQLTSRLFEYPESAFELVHSCRAALIPGFPYFLIYNVSSDTITIHAVWHTSRNPDTLKRRLGASGE